MSFQIIRNELEFADLLHFPSETYLRPILKRISYLLIFLFCLSQARQAIYFVYFYVNQARIEEQFCEQKTSSCNGTCHLAKQLKKMSGTEKSPRPKYAGEPRGFVFVKPQQDRAFVFRQSDPLVLCGIVVVHASDGYVRSVDVPPDVLAIV